jgi:hypothetical protein
VVVGALTSGVAPVISQWLGLGLVSAGVALVAVGGQQIPSPARAGT